MSLSSMVAVPVTLPSVPCTLDTIMCLTVKAASECDESTVQSAAWAEPTEPQRSPRTGSTRRVCEASDMSDLLKRVSYFCFKSYLR